MLKSTLLRNLIPPKEWDSFKLKILFQAYLGSLDPIPLGPLFQPVVLEKRDLGPLLQDPSKETRTKIVKVFQDSH